MDVRLLIDFGSTFTKVVAVDVLNETITGRAQSPSTVSTDVTIGLKRAIDELKRITGTHDLDEAKALACSSAAGGLRMVSVGLVPSLTVKAGTLAALGAGAKVVASYSYKLTYQELLNIEELSPDIILLTGGTDGGDEDTILHNARLLANSKLVAPVVIAGNKVIQEAVKSILDAKGKYSKNIENVLPEIGTLNVEPCRNLIRRIFIDNIIKAKGLDKVNRMIGGVIMPTPVAVLKAARLLVEGCDGEKGLGELMVVDLGGATTDVHSIAVGEPTESGIVIKGLPEPYVKRSVEGDLGIRYNSNRVLELAGRDGLMDRLTLPMEETMMAGIVYSFDMNPGTLANSELEISVETAMSRVIVAMATERHVGHLKLIHYPQGDIFMQRGKDLTQLATVIGTGGPLIFGHNKELILQGTLFDGAKPFVLKPKQPRFYIDERYIMYAMGLLAEESPRTAFRIMKKYLSKVEVL